MELTEVMGVNQPMAKAGPVLVVRGETESGPVLQLIVVKGDRPVKVFNLYQKHLHGSPEGLDLIESFISEARHAGENGDG